MVNLSGMCKVSSLLWVLLIFLSNDATAQDTYEGQVMEKDSMTAISSVSVTLVKEKIVVKTNARGYFRIDSENGVPNDTLVFTSVGYLTYNVAVSDFVNNGTIIMEYSNVRLNQVDINARKLKTRRLNAFDLGDIKKDRDYTPNPYSSHYAYAKLFDAPELNFILTTIEFGRTVYGPAGFARVKSNPYTRFLIHIMSVNQQSGKPDEVLLSKQISLDDNSTWITIDMSKEAIPISTKNFFIAVEWLRIPYNEVVKLENAPRLERVTKKGKEIIASVSQYRMLYQPALVTYKKKKRPPSFIKDRKGRWIENTAGDEVALSATVKI